MKKLIVFSLPLLFCWTAHGQGVVLQPGESYSYVFSSLPKIQEHIPGNVRLAEAGVNCTALGGPIQFTFEMYENSLGESPLLSQTSVPPDYYLLCRVNDAWQDIQGAVKVTCGPVSMKVDAFLFRVVVIPEPGFVDVYEGSFGVPEPGIPSFLLAGAVAGALQRRFRVGFPAKLVRHGGPRTTE